VEELIRRGYDERTASHYVALVGDTPLLDEEGNTLVMDRDGTVLARLKDFP
jgi:ribulose-5-phosphate 4-epimerase/fuculose-1-phosphate aldolase